MKQISVSFWSRAESAVHVFRLWSASSKSGSKGAPRTFHGNLREQSVAWEEPLKLHAFHNPFFYFRLYIFAEDRTK